ncbi:MAG: aminotransferase [Clostridia bacterium]|jgi:DNA-binding transcriptional MocR family regulator|nr:aminotransferase [Clostridia bacterium]
MSVKFASRVQQMESSEIRELLKLTENPEVISFAGGVPAPELFPINELIQVTKEVLEESGEQALQYGTTEGFNPLREKIAKRMNKKFKTNFGIENILITNGSQQGLDFTGKIFLDQGDVVLCESPTYLAAINAFKAYEPRFVEVQSDDEGMRIDELESLLKTTQNVKFIYIVPDFQNPSGTSWSPERRKQFMQVVKEYDVVVVEDSPYSEIRFEGATPPSMKSMDEKGQVICLGTFSKTFCPGLRIGWVAAETNILEKYILVKQSADLHTSTLNQRNISRYMDSYDFDANIDKIKEVYKKRRDIMLEAIEEEFPKEVRFTRPMGGLFLWVELPEHMDARDVFTKCIKNKVAFVPGESFFPNNRKKNTLRLNYSNMPEDRIVEGIKRIALVLRDLL